MNISTHITYIIFCSANLPFFPHRNCLFQKFYFPGGTLQLAWYCASTTGWMSVLALYWHNTGWKMAEYWHSSEMSLGWELFVNTGAVLKTVLRLYRRSVWRGTGISTKCHSAGSCLSQIITEILNNFYLSICPKFDRSSVKLFNNLLRVRKRF